LEDAVFAEGDVTDTSTWALPATNVFAGIEAKKAPVAWVTGVTTGVFGAP
jgi:hypothetical protein